VILFSNVKHKIHHAPVVRTKEAHSSTVFSSVGFGAMCRKALLTGVDCEDGIFKSKTEDGVGASAGALFADSFTTCSTKNMCN
jgi:hypothetical protein